MLSLKKEVEIKQKNPKICFSSFTFSVPPVLFQQTWLCRCTVLGSVARMRSLLWLRRVLSPPAPSTESPASKTLANAYFMKVTLPGFQFHFCNFKIPIISSLKILWMFNSPKYFVIYRWMDFPKKKLIFPFLVLGNFEISFVFSLITSLFFCP